MSIPSSSKNAMAASPQAGFSLIEVSLIVLLLLFVSVSLYTLSREERAADATTEIYDKMTVLEEAIELYAALHYRYPCPAPIRTEFGAADFGVELRDAATGLCKENVIDGVQRIASDSGSTRRDVFHGMPPVRTLGLERDMAIDGFNNRFTYSVSNGHSQQSATHYIEWDTTAQHYMLIPNVSGIFMLVYNSITDVVEPLQNLYPSTAQQEHNYPPYLLMSHGANGFGSFDKYANSSSSPHILPSSQPMDLGEEERNLKFINADSTGTTFTDMSMHYKSGLIGGDGSVRVQDDVLRYRRKAPCDNLHAPIALIAAVDARQCDGDIFSINPLTTECSIFGAAGPQLLVLQDVEHKMGGGLIHQESLELTDHEQLFKGKVEYNFEESPFSAPSPSIALAWRPLEFAPEAGMTGNYHQRIFTWQVLSNPTVKAFLELIGDADNYNSNLPSVNLSLSASGNPDITALLYRMDGSILSPAIGSSIAMDASTEMMIASLPLEAVDVASATPAVPLTGAALEVLQIGHSYTTGFTDQINMLDTIKTGLYELLLLAVDDTEKDYAHSVARCYLQHKWWR